MTGPIRATAQRHSYKAMALGGTPQSLSVQDSTNFNFGAGSASFAIWHYPTATPGFIHTMLGKLDTSPEKRNWHLGQWSSNNSAALISTTTDATGQVFVQTANIATLNAWNFSMGVVDKVNNLLKCCLNDGTWATTAFSGTIFNNDQVLGIGHSTGGWNDYFQGRLAKAMVWKGVALSTSDYTWLFNGGYARQYPEVQTTLGTGLVYYNELSSSPWTQQVGPATGINGTPTQAGGIRG